MQNITNNKFVSVIIPVFNSEGIISNLIKDTEKELLKLKKENVINQYEIILVNDFSKDESLKKILEFKNNRTIKLIDLKKNIGQHLATVCGLFYSSGSIFVTMDDDYQHSPRNIPKIIQPILKNKSDVCYAKYNLRKHSFWKILLSDLNNYFLSFLFKYKKMDLKVSSFRSFNMNVKDTIISTTKNKLYLDGIILQNFNRIDQIEVIHKERILGKST